MKMKSLAKHIINTELSRQGLNKEQLTQKLKDMGFEVTTAQNLRNKLNNGNFSVVMFFECMKALGVKNISLEDLYRE